MLYKPGTVFIMRSSFDGGIAQLGERLHGMQEVSGSIPLTSTKRERRQYKAANSGKTRSPSSRGLGHYPFTVGTGVRIPVGTPDKAPSIELGAKPARPVQVSAEW